MIKSEIDDFDEGKSFISKSQLEKIDTSKENRNLQRFDC